MKNQGFRGVVVLSAMAVLTFYSGRSNAQSLTGTWCLQEEPLAITFFGKDSIRVTSAGEDGVNGAGHYEKQDTIFVATISNDELLVRMGYQYHWRNDSTIDARTLFLTVGGDSVDVARRGVVMKRCAPVPRSPGSAPVK